MIKLKSLLLERTLYHGTTRDAAESIAKIGLIPMTGEFVMGSYGCEYDEKDIPELVFATNKKQLDKAVGAITAQIAAKLKKNYHDVTDEEFIAYGALIKINDGDDYFEKRPDKEEEEDFYAEYPPTVEPGDYYSHDSVAVDDILTGTAMTRLLKRYNLWPRKYGGTNEKENRRKHLIKMAIKYHKNIDPKKIVQRIMSLPLEDIDDWYFKYGYNEL